MSALSSFKWKSSKIENNPEFHQLLNGYSMLYSYTLKEKKQRPVTYTHTHIYIHNDKQK